MLGGDIDACFVDGTRNVRPSLHEGQGDAEIVNAVFLGTQWRAAVERLESAPTRWLGEVLSLAGGGSAVRIHPVFLLLPLAAGAADVRGAMRTNG